MKSHRNDGGYAILLVMGFTLVLVTLLAATYNYSSTELRIAGKQSDIEDALYVAQGAVEQAAACWARRGKAPWSTNGVIGRGQFVVAIVPAAMMSDAPRTISDYVDIDPNTAGRSDNYLLVEQIDGSTIVKNTLLTTTQTSFQCEAAYIRFRTGGTGSQTTLKLDGNTYTNNNDDYYEIFSPAMSVIISKRVVDAELRWCLTLATSCASFIPSN